jgi:hypothetical protein
MGERSLSAGPSEPLRLAKLRNADCARYRRAEGAMFQY